MAQPETHLYSLSARCAQQRAQLGRHWHVIAYHARRADRVTAAVRNALSYLPAVLPWILRLLFKRR